jgi:hypothetical protein
VLVLSCVVLAVATVGFVLAVREQDIPPLPTENPELKHLQERRAQLFENLKDLQFEYLQGKLSDEDYRSLKVGFQNDLAVVLASIDMQQEPAAGVPRIDTKPKGAASEARSEKQVPQTCPSCGAQNSPDHRFCGSCGAQL